MAYIRRLPSGLYQATVRMPNGDRITETDKLKSVVKTWATKQEAAYKSGDRRDPRAGQITLGEWRERVSASRGLEAPTRAKLDSIWRTHCAGEWAAWPMSAVTRLEAQDWINRLRQTRRARHKGKTSRGGKDIPLLAPATIHECANTMGKLYGLAMKETPPLVISNPFAGLDLPTIAPRPVEFLERHEAEVLFAAIEDVKWRTLVQLGTHVGLRPGELYGLHGNRVDWPRRLVHVTHVMTRYGLREHPKSKKSHRTVPVPEEILEAMAALMRGRRAFATCTCPKVLPDGTRKPGEGACPALVFPAAEGGPIDDGNFRDRVWNPAVRASGVRRFPPKIMRHTAASWLVQDGVPLYDVQDLLGHESYATTSRYAHLRPEAHEKVIASWARRTDGQDFPVVTHQ